MDLKRNFPAILLTTAFLVTAHAQAATGADTIPAAKPEVEQRLGDEPFIEERMQKAAQYMEKERWQSAKDVYDEVLAAQPYNLNAVYFRAYCNERLLHYGLARADYEFILKYEPKHFSSLMGLAVLKQKESHFMEALDLANYIVEQHPDSVLSWVVRANIEEEQGLLPLAQYDYMRAYELSPSPSSRKYLLQAIELMIRQKRKEEARRELDKLVKSGVPKSSLQYYYRQLKGKYQTP